MEGAMPNTPLDREEDKKEIFARVWKRVMGDHTDACPITWEETGGDQAQTTTEQQQTLVTEEAAQTEEKTVLPAPHVPRGGQRLHSDFPRDDAQGVLGPQCLDCAPLLQELIRRELADCREYQTLSRRAGGGPARVLAGLAGEKKRRAKRLSAAKFLDARGGVKPRGRQRAPGARPPAHPSAPRAATPPHAGPAPGPEGEKCPPVTSYLGTLRRRFAQEQATMAAYLTGTETTTDPCLQQLFWEHAREAWDQACKIRTLVEQA